MQEMLLVINSGSTSIKFSAYLCESSLDLIKRDEFELNTDHEHIFNTLFDSIDALKNQYELKAVGHRVVHGGNDFYQPVRITDAVMEKLFTFVPYAPFHQPDNLKGIEIFEKRYPGLLQIACFDTGFHHTQTRLARLYPLPQKLIDEGIIRYGFHGLSYEYIASVLPSRIGQTADKNIIVAHLGGGASLCAMRQCKSVATSMGLTALEGLMMSTRCGSIDPGIILYLLEQKKLSSNEISNILYKQSGLLGVSGLSGDVRELSASQTPHAKEALDLFAYRAAQEIGALMMVLGGCDAVVFTGGIGANSALVRHKICEYLTWLGLTLNKHANEKNATLISEINSPVIACVIPSNEEKIIAQYTYQFIRGQYGNH